MFILTKYKLNRILEKIENLEIGAFYLSFDSESDEERKEVVNKLRSSGMTYYESEEDQTNGIIVYSWRDDNKQQRIASKIKSIVKSKSTRFILIPLAKTDYRLYNMKF